MYKGGVYYYYFATQCDVFPSNVEQKIHVSIL